MGTIQVFGSSWDLTSRVAANSKKILAIANIIAGVLGMILAL
jgi:hypothetical protein